MKLNRPTVGNNSRAFLQTETLLLMSVLTVGLTYAIALAIPTPESFGDGTERVEFIAPTAAETARKEEMDRIALGGEHYKELRIVDESPGISNPKIYETNRFDLPEDAEVLGVIVEGEACAFLISHMSNEAHIINLTLGGQAVSASYCGLADCARVFTDADSTSSIPLNIGGLDIDNQLVFELYGQRYGQLSSAIPLSELAFSRTTWGKWSLAHPQTNLWLQPELSTPAWGS